MATTDYQNLYSDEEEEVGIGLQEQLMANMKSTYSTASAWGFWGYAVSGKILYEITSHAIFLGLPFMVVYGMQSIDDMQWEETLKIARKEVESDTMKQMSNVRPRVSR
jgi:hypothetical protein